MGSASVLFCVSISFLTFFDLKRPLACTFGAAVRGEGFACEKGKVKQARAQNRRTGSVRA
jgi:hypothetical protein